jgi:regulator of RNase E activity RraA
MYKEPSVDLRSVLTELSEFDTALLANTMEYVDPATPAHEFYMGGAIRSVTPTLGPTVGIAVTCEMDSSSPGGTAIMDPFWRHLEQMTATGLPSVWVVKAVGSRPDHECIIGDGMAKLLRAAGCVGLVTDGGVRDIPGLLATPLAAYCHGPVIHHCALRITSVDKPVEVGGITVHPGDVVHANNEGVIRIPQSAAELLPARAARMRAAESETHRIWRRTDVPLAEKRKWVQNVFTEFGFVAGHGKQAHELTGSNG